MQPRSLTFRLEPVTRDTGEILDTNALVCFTFGMTTNAPSLNDIHNQLLALRVGGTARIAGMPWTVTRTGADRYATNDDCGMDGFSSVELAKHLHQLATSPTD